MDLHRRSYIKAAALGSASLFLSPLNLGDFWNKIEFFSVFRHPCADPVKADLASQAVATAMSTLGEGGAVFIEPYRRTIKKVYAENVRCVGGALPRYNDNYYLSYFYNAEKKAYTKLRNAGSRYIPRDLVFKDKEQTITMAYHGSDLLINRYKNQWRPSERHLQQIAEMAEEYRQVGLFKRNISASNLILDKSQDRLIAIDFKYAVPRSFDVLAQEIQHQHLLLPRISKDLPLRLLSSFADFQHKQVVAYTEASEKLYANGDVDLNNHEERLRFLKIISAAV